MFGLAALLERCPSAPANAPALLYANSSDIRDVDESVLEGVWSLGVFKESVTTFFASAESTLRALERAISKDDVPTARSLAHRLHGSSGMIGARRVERAAAALEQLAESDSLSGATDLAAELEHTLGIARVAMLRWGERRGATGSERETASGPTPASQAPIA